jgi:hypothetical protein
MLHWVENGWMEFLRTTGSRAGEDECNGYTPASSVGPPAAFPSPATLATSEERSIGINYLFGSDFQGSHFLERC